MTFMTVRLFPVFILLCCCCCFFRLLSLCPFLVYYCRLLNGSLCLLSFVFVICANGLSLLKLEMNIVNIMVVIFFRFLLFCIRQMIVVALLLFFWNPSSIVIICSQLSAEGTQSLYASLSPFLILI